LRSVVSEGGL